jgi:hypothetical protein
MTSLCRPSPEDSPVSRSNVNNAAVVRKIGMHVISNADCHLFCSFFSFFGVVRRLTCLLLLLFFLYDAQSRPVIVFLRKLEYYKGIIYLLSSRGIQFDNVILSLIY